MIALHGAGVEETVAVMGTAITPEQLKLLGGYAEEVVLALDADRAGREAMLRAQRVAGSGRLRLLVAAMPEGEDPADMMRTEEGSNRLRELLADAVDLAVFHVRAILGDADLSTPPGATARSTRSCRCSSGWGRRSPARRWSARSPTASTPPRSWSPTRMKTGGRRPRRPAPSRPGGRTANRGAAGTAARRGASRPRRSGARR